MDLGDINVKQTADEGRKMELRHPSTGELIMDGGDPAEAQHIVFCGKFSDVYQKHGRDVTNRRLKSSVGKRKVTVSAEQLEMEAAEEAARCAKSWNLVVGGNKVGPRFEDLYAVLSDPKFVWLREASVEFIEDESNFS